MSDALLSLRGLTRRHGKTTVLGGVDLELDAGARLTIAGPSGAGKTTLLRLVAGLDRADGGSIHVSGRLATEGRKLHLAPWERGVQMVFQDLALWPTRSVRANVSDALRAAGVDRSTARERADAILSRLGIADHARRKPGSLSGGEARRLAFARALALEPKLLLLDEPFASLDPEARAQGQELLREVLEATQAAVVLVSHDPAEAEALGGDVLVLRDGELTQPEAQAA